MTDLPVPPPLSPADAEYAAIVVTQPGQAVPQIQTQEANAAERAALARALAYACDVIAGYQMDIRGSAWTGVDLVAVGFCQGRAYEEALPRIGRIARGEELTV